MAQLAEILESVRKLTPDERVRLLEELQRSNAAEVFGKYSSVPTSSELFCERKRGEIELEDTPGSLRS